MRAANRLALAIAVLAAIVWNTAASAHRRDELLQAARIGVEPGRLDLELDLTPGIEVAAAVIAQIDTNRDGVLSDEEQRTYVRHVLDGIDLRLDGRALRADPVDAAFPPVDVMRRGEGTIGLRSAVVVPRSSSGEHRLVFRNSNLPGMSVYLANALVSRSDRVRVTAQQRDPEQRDLTIEYVVAGGPDASSPLWLLGGLAGAAGAAAFLMRPSRARQPRARP